MEKDTKSSKKYLAIKYGRIATGVLAIGWLIMFIYDIFIATESFWNWDILIAFAIILLGDVVKENKHEAALSKQYDLLFKVIDKQLPGVVLNQNFAIPMSETEKKELARKVKGSCLKYIHERKNYYSELIINSSKEDLRILRDSYYGDKLKEEYEAYLYIMLKNLGMQ